MSRCAARTFATSIIAAAFLFSAADLQAAKLRAARPSAPRTAPGTGGGGCHTFGFVPAGLAASYKSTNIGQGGAVVNYTVTYLSDSAAQSKTRQVVSVPGVGNANADTTINYETANSLRAVKDMTVEVKITSPIAFTTSVKSVFVPALTWGPAAGWCAGASWSIPATTLTTTVNTGFGAPTNTVTTTLAGTGQVLAVNESITVQGGTFTTVKYRGVNIASNCAANDPNCKDGSPQPVNVWLWTQHPIVIRQDVLDSAGTTVVSQTELTAVTGASVAPSVQVEGDAPSGFQSEDFR